MGHAANSANIEQTVTDNLTDSAPAGQRDRSKILVVDDQ